MFHITLGSFIWVRHYHYRNNCINKTLSVRKTKSKFVFLHPQEHAQNNSDRLWQDRILIMSSHVTIEKTTTIQTILEHNNVRQSN